MQPLQEHKNFFKKQAIGPTKNCKNSIIRVQCAYVISNNGSSNNLPCYPPVINFRMLSIGGQGY